MEDILNLNVGGRHFEVEKSVLHRYPESFFGKMMNSDWKETSDSIIELQRKGILFKFVYDYMFYGKLPRDEHGSSLLGANQLKELIEEADYYNLPGLMKECNELLNVPEVELQVQRYKKISRLVETASDNSVGTIVLDGPPDSLVSLLRSNPVVPSWMTGEIKHCYDKIFKSTSVDKVNVDELIQEAQQSPFGRGNETVVDAKVRDSLEIPASRLENMRGLSREFEISSLAPNMYLALRPYKLVIYREGGHFDDHRDSVRGENHIGTCVLILNSAYTGGELEVSHGDETVVVTGPGRWVAMYGDCVHKIYPVTSGTRVSLIFDILKFPGERDHVWPSTGDFNICEEFNPEGRIAAKSSAAPANATPEGDLRDKIYAALDKELDEFDTVSICLEHLYPACQANLDFLKGRDFGLYSMFKERYSVGVTPITIGRVCPNEMADEDIEAGISFSEFAYKGFWLLNPRQENVLVIPQALSKNSVLQYSEINFTGNESQGDEYVYLVAALVIRKRG